MLSQYSSVRIYGVFQSLRARFPQYQPLMNDRGCSRLDSAIRSALHIYGNPREDSITAESYAQAVQYVQTELAAIEWVLNNPNLASSIAAQVLERRDNR